MYDALFLSPHLDDAVLSAGLKIADLVRQSKKVLIVTFFSEAVGVPSPDAAKFIINSHSQSSETLFSRRCLEDIKACQTLRADYLHLGLSDALFRVTTLGQPVYSNFDQVFSGIIQPGDSQTQQDLLQLMIRLKETLCHTQSQIFAPLGIGGHVDHHLVFNAARATFPAAMYWEDVPYQSNVRQVMARIRATNSQDTVQLVNTIAKSHQHQGKYRAVQCYKTQIDGLEANGLSQLHYQLEKYYAFHDQKKQ